MKFDSNDANGILAELPEALLITALRGEIVFANRALTRLTGFSADEVIGKDVSILLPTPERRRVQVKEWLARWADDPDAESLRYLNLEAATKSGEARLVSLRVSKHEGGDEPLFLVVLRDVTAQHETVAQLRHAQLVTNRILAIGEDGVLSIDPSHRITYWNGTAERIFGYSEREVLGKPISVILPEDVASRHEAMINEFAASTSASRLMGQRGEIRGRHKDGHLIPLEASITKTTIDGELVLSAQVRDISARKAAEAAVKQSEARFRAVFEHALEAMALLAPDGRVLEINSAAAQLLPTVPVDAFFWELDWWRGDASEAQRGELKANVERCRSGEVIRARTTLEGADGADHEIDFSLLPVTAGDGEVIYIIAEGRDLT